MNIHETLAKFEQLKEEQKRTMETIDKLTLLAEQMLFELKIRNGGFKNANGQNI